MRPFIGTVGKRLADDLAMRHELAARTQDAEQFRIGRHVCLVDNQICQIIGQADLARISRLNVQPRSQQSCGVGRFASRFQPIPLRQLAKDDAFALLCQCQR